MIKAYITVLLFVAAAAVAEPLAEEGGAARLDLKVGFTRYAFTSVNRNDAEAAFKVFVQTVAKQRGYEAKASIFVFEAAEEFENAIRSGQVNMAIIDTWRFLRMNVDGITTPTVSVVNGRGAVKSYLLLVRASGPFARLEDLRGRDILEIETSSAHLGGSWIGTLLLERRLGSVSSFFSRMQGVTKVSAAVLPVFFGQKPACIVDEDSFATMVDLNQQVGQALRVLERSEPLLDSVICLRDSGWESPRHRVDVARALEELHSHPAGQQILTLFKIGRLVAFEPKHLETLRRLQASFDAHRQAAND